MSRQGFGLAFSKKRSQAMQYRPAVFALGLAYANLDYSLLECFM